MLGLARRYGYQCPQRGGRGECRRADKRTPFRAAAVAPPAGAEFMQRLSGALHGTLGSYLCDAVHEDCVDILACVLVSRA
jgi:hypothetical protein